jgi:hypothetical protein
MNASVFPVGHYGGTRPGDEPVHVVRVGWQQHRLTENAFGVWVLTHGLVEVGRGHWTEYDVVQQAERAGITDAAQLLAELVANGTVAVVQDEPDEAAGFAKSHRLDVLFVGLGVPPDQPDGHAVGVPGLGAAAVLDADCYELWQWGSVAPTLWDSCEVRAAVLGHVGQPMDPVDALAEILGDLRVLVAHGCAYLDVAPAA